MYQKPSTCGGCPLETRGAGWVLPGGPPSSPVLFLGESPGEREVELQEPFVGPAGGKLNHLLYRLGRARGDQRVGNVIQCRPPWDKLEKMPWEYAIEWCRPNLQKLLDGPHKVIVTLGAVPTRQLLKTHGNLKDLHGTVTRFEVGAGRSVWVVPTFHPSHLLRGAHNLTGTVLFDIARAFEIAEEGWEPDEPLFHLDPAPIVFQAWVRGYLEAVAADPERTWLSVDVETPDKERKLDEGELKSIDRSMEILRVNLSYRTDEGLTVPFVGPYIALIGECLGTVGPKWYWNKQYDLRRLWAVYGVEGLRGPQLDGMDAWHALHSDVPKGLGFVAPYYSRWGPWKHLAKVNPVLYAAGDSVQNQRCCFGVAADLVSQGMWDVFYRHMHELDRLALQASCRVGLKVDRPAVEAMRDDLREKSQGFWQGLQDLAPESVKPLHPKAGWTRRPEGETFLWPQEGKFGRTARPILERTEELPVKVCQTCGASQITVKHRCKDAAGKPRPELPVILEQPIPVPRWYVREDFNPGSWQQVLACIKAFGHKPGKERGKETTNRETIERLAEGKPKSRKDEERRELYRTLLDFREVKKILGTYVEGTLRRLDADAAAGITDGRLHPTVSNNPSTLRTAYNNPNLQNVVADKRGGKSLASGFRKAIVAEPGCKLVELDWSGIEAVNVGWCMQDPDYIRLAWLGVHDFLCSHAIGEPADLSWSVDDLLRFFAETKAKFPVERDQSKRMVHGTNYLETVEGIYKRFRKLFKGIRDAQRLQDLYYGIAPKLRHWQTAVQDLAYQQEYLGGPGAHPFSYRHEFYNVREFRLITGAEAAYRQHRRLPTSFMNGRHYAVGPGEDAKRAVAFWGQSIAAGTIRETGLRLFDPDLPNYVGDLFFGKTPLRAVIHDSFLNEVPDSKVDVLIERTHREMTRMIEQMPMPPEWGLGPYLQFGVEVKVGTDWQNMQKVKVPQPWLAVLKGDSGSGEVDLGDRAVVDEVEDESEEEWGEEEWDGPVAAGGAAVGDSDDIPF